MPPSSQAGPAVLAVPAAARLEINASCYKCVFDAYYGQFDVDQCKGQIPSHIANTSNNGLEEFEQLMVDLNSALRHNRWMQWVRKGFMFLLLIYIGLEFVIGRLYF